MAAITVACGMVTGGGGAGNITSANSAAVRKRSPGCIAIAFKIAALIGRLMDRLSDLGGIKGFPKLR